jgi:hypothetical protein
MTEKVVILDDVFTENQLHFFKSQLLNSYRGEATDKPFVSVYENSVNSGWFEVDEPHDNSIVCENLLNLTKKYYSEVKDIRGYDFWAHYNTRPQEWHFDKDETAYIKYGIERFPVCSIICYLEVDLQEGGSLVIEPGIKIEPRTNRMILMAPGVYHFVEEYTGERIGVNINPWCTKMYN